MTFSSEALNNVNDFYSQHYLDEIFPKDLGDILESIKQHHPAPPAGKTASFPNLKGQRQHYASALRHLYDAPVEQRWENFLRLLSPMLATLGYRDLRFELVQLDEVSLPTLTHIKTDKNEPYLLLCPVFSLASEAQANTTSPLDLPVLDSEGQVLLKGATWEDALTSAFRDSPTLRWVLLVHQDEWLLIDRQKWGRKSMLQVVLKDLFSLPRYEDAAHTVAVLFSPFVMAPSSGQAPYLDTLEDKSHRHAFGVTEDLKEALREAIEVLGNEVLAIAGQGDRFRGQIKLEGVLKEHQEQQHLPPTSVDEQLSLECLRFMYRLLFIFYVEARSDLGYAPINATAYLQGYSLEHLRQLETLEFTQEEALEGSYLHQSLLRLFGLFWTGFEHGKAHSQLGIFGSSTIDTQGQGFTLAPLQGRLFDPLQMPLLNSLVANGDKPKAKPTYLRNEALQKVIRLLSSVQTKWGLKRISYATLGINQLGAVYEALLSFRGFIAREDLMEVKQDPSKVKKDKKEGEDSYEDPEGEDENDSDSDKPKAKKEKAHDELAPAFFVPVTQEGEYTRVECMFEGKRRIYPKGSFIYRLTGRARERSASYYTPEVLTKTLVAEALKELTVGKTSDELLKLTICEPAMGSAAFLNEAINQLAELILERRQAELDRTIPHGDYAREKQRIKMFLADNNVFGVDLNPVAVELAEVSLWLNALFHPNPPQKDKPAGQTQEAPAQPAPPKPSPTPNPQGQGESKPGDTPQSTQEGAIQVPWFGLQLFAGNSLMGARRDVFHQIQMTPGKKAADDLDWRKAIPKPLPWSEDFPKGAIFHFLVPDEGMAQYGDKVVKGIAPKELEHIKAWSKAICAPFTKDEAARLNRYSRLAHALWLAHADKLAQVRKDSSDNLHVWPEQAENTPGLSTTDKERAYRRGLRSEGQKNVSPYRRLKMAMDLWCALWVWPIEQAEHLPSRADWLNLLNLLLLGDRIDDQTVSAHAYGAAQGDLLTGEFEAVQGNLLLAQAEPTRDIHGHVDLDTLIEFYPALHIATQVAKEHRFFHWELEFADLFQTRGGFDLILGNPPWLKVEWDEKGLLSEHDPRFALHKLSAKEASERREQTFEVYPDTRSAYLLDYSNIAGLSAFLNARQNYPLLERQQSNLYKCFLPLVWRIGTGVQGLVHPEGVYDDPKGGILREVLYPRLRLHAQFANERLLFAEVDNHTRYSLNLYGPERSKPRFKTIANLFDPQTLSESLAHDGYGPVPGIKSEAGKWELRGHAKRLIRVDETLLATFARLYDEPGTPPPARVYPRFIAKS